MDNTKSQLQPVSDEYQKAIIQVLRTVYPSIPYFAQTITKDAIGVTAHECGDISTLKINPKDIQKPVWRARKFQVVLYGWDKSVLDTKTRYCFLYGPKPNSRYFFADGVLQKAFPYSYEAKKLEESDFTSLDITDIGSFAKLLADKSTGYYNDDQPGFLFSGKGYYKVWYVNEWDKRDWRWKEISLFSEFSNLNPRVTWKKELLLRVSEGCETLTCKHLRFGDLQQFLFLFANNIDKDINIKIGNHPNVPGRFESEFSLYSPKLQLQPVGLFIKDILRDLK